MKVTRVPHGLELGKPAPGYERTPGLHMSGIYGPLYKAMQPKRYDKRDAEGNPLEFNPNFMELGLAFEEMLEPALRERLFTNERPGEFSTKDTSQPVIFTPDQFIFEGGKFILGEFKLTWMWLNRDITDPKFDKWLCQVKAYCHHLETPYARIYAFFVVGAGKPPVPELAAWDFEFTAKELRENWQMLKRYAIRTGLLAP